VSNDVDPDSRFNLQVSGDGTTLSGTIKIYCTNVSSSACLGAAKSFENLNQTVNGLSINLSVAVTDVSLFSDVEVSWLDFERSGKVGAKNGDSQRVNNFLGFGAANKIRLHSAGVGYGGQINSLTPAHELGHAIGLNHQWNNTNSLMSYSSNRISTITDAQMRNLIGSYR
jgi:hypothetical protein